MNDKHQIWLEQMWGQKCVESLKKRGFDAHLVPDLEQARALALEITSTHQSFGLGGSSTTRELKLPEELRARGKVVYDHWQEGLTPAGSLEIRHKQLGCDCFFSSANAIAATGEIVNIDGAGNRVGAMAYGPKKVVIIAGMNKVKPDLQSALDRAKNIAAPMRAKSMNLDTPCTKTGFCSDCNSPARICNITSIIHRKPMLTDVSVILVNQHLGY